ncbi:glycoside hydrolase family 57 protein [Candidatus Pacearchaeota archaeon]|nr:glycoside hydrolase family 57 protein [Candidatus Pacearchaeota archaeon]
MVSVCIYFQVHQPYRIKEYSIFEIGKDIDCFEDSSDSNTNNAKILKKVSNKCYLPANEVLLELLNNHPEFKISFSFSGVFLEQLEQYEPEVLESFQKLIDTTQVEILAETYHHSLSFIYSKEEFKEQVKLHKEIVQRLFGIVPAVFRNTELIYNNEIAKEVESMGYKGILAEGADHILGWKSPNFLYRPANTSNIKLLLKNYKLSDDIAFRFSENTWKEWPLTASKYADWITKVNGNGNVVNLFMDYETFGEHQWEATGIFNFLHHLPSEILKHPDNDFKTPSEIINSYSTIGTCDVEKYISWADENRDLSAWLGNDMQHEAINKIYSLRDKILSSNNSDLIHKWRKLQTSDHYYYMSTKQFSDGEVHKYFSPYASPYDAFISFMNVLHDLELELSKDEIIEEVTTIT